MKNHEPRNARIILSIAGITVFCLLLIWVSYARKRVFDREDAIRFGLQRNTNLAIAFEQFTIRTIRSADAMLQMIRMAHRNKHPLEVKEMVSLHSLDSNMVEGLVITDAGGKVLASSETSASVLPDEQTLQFHRNDRSDSLLLSTPRTWQPGGEPVVAISRRLTDESENFSGVAAVLIKPAMFTSFYADAELFSDDILSLIAPDGITYARRTGNRESWGESIIKSPLFQHIQNHRDSFYFAPDAIRGIPTWFSYRVINDYPIIVTVGSSEASLLAGFETRQSKYVIPRVIISILIIGIAIVIAVFILHRRRVAQAVAVSEKKYQDLLTEQMIAVQEREREWIGRELHDNVNQVLTTAKLYLDTASRESGSPLIPRSMQLINDSISDIRNLSHQLSAPTLGTRSLIDSFNALIEDVAHATGIRFQFHHDDYKRPVKMSLKLALYRILQEQLSNVSKHARASEVIITLAQTKDELQFTIRDDGRGFDARQKSAGMGFNNIISRARVFDGSVHIDAAPGKGCTLFVSIPMVDATIAS